MKDFEDLKMFGIASRQIYLENTDWLVIRQQEINIPVPQDALNKRQLARDEISLIRDALDYSEIQHLTKEF